MPKPRNLLERIATVRDDEVGPVALAALGFFLVLCGYFMLRPVREAMGVERGMGELRVLFIATMVVTVLGNIVLGAVVARVARGRLVSVVYRTVIVCLVAFFVLLRFFPDQVGTDTGRVFYVWLSVANLFLTSLFWVTLSDCLELSQSKRLFPIIAVGGTLGAIAGASINRVLVESIGIEWFFLIAIGFLEAGVFTLSLFRRACGRRGWRGDPVERDRPLGGRSWQGIWLVMRSPFLMGIVGYILLLAVAHTLLYFATREIIADSAETTAGRSALFANIDILTQVMTLVVQLFVVGRLMRWMGVGVSLAALPVVLVGGFTALTLWPIYAAAAIFEAVFRVGKYAIARPARETLFTIVSDNERLAAKPFIDTFVYRFGDVLGTALTPVLLVAAPVAVGWAGVGLWLGRRQSALAGDLADKAPSP